MAKAKTHVPHVSLHDWTVLAAILGFVTYAVPIVIEIVGGNLVAAQGGIYLLLIMLAMLVPGALGVWAASRRHPVVLWVVAALVIGAWAIWWREFALVSPVPAFYAVAAGLAWVGRRRGISEDSIRRRR